MFRVKGLGFRGFGLSQVLREGFRSVVNDEAAVSIPGCLR